MGMGIFQRARSFLKCTFCKALILFSDRTARVPMVYSRWRKRNAIGYTMRTRLSKTNESLSGRRSDHPLSEEIWYELPRADQHRRLQFSHLNSSQNLKADGKQWERHQKKMQILFVKLCEIAISGAKILKVTCSSN